MPKTKLKKNTKRGKKIKKIRCLCDNGGKMCIVRDCLCPLHFISLKE